MDSGLQALIVAGLAPWLLACQAGGAGAVASPSPSVKVVDMRLGRALGDDKRVRQPQDVFAAQDTFFLSVETEGTAPRAAALQVRWTRGSEVLAETVQTIAADGPAVTEFHARKAVGWPPGEYAVELWVDQVPAGRRGLSVKETP
jgi:hypothetical protein